MSWSDSGPYARVFVTTAAAPPAPLTWRVETTSRGVSIHFTGDIDENADFGPLYPHLRGHLTFDLAEVNRVNSCGVREWVHFHREIAALPVVIEYHHCSPTIVAQLNAISNFRGRARVRSFFAPYFCDRCGADAKLLVQVGPDAAATTLPDFECANCGGPLVFDDIPERYLSFLKEQ